MAKAVRARAATTATATTASNGDGRKIRAKKGFMGSAIAAVPMNPFLIYHLLRRHWHFYNVNITRG